jgi:hypothetical protein
VVRNNLASAFGIDKKPGMVADHNLKVANPTRIFVDPGRHDFHLRKGSQAVDTGSPELAPDIDIEKVPRPWGRGYDLGAYEYHEGNVEAEPPPTVAPRGAPLQDQARQERDREDEPASPNAESMRNAGVQPDVAPPIAPRPKSDVSIPEDHRSSGSGGLRILAVVLLAAALLFIAWRIGR